MISHKNNIPFFKEGIPLPRVVFSGGRVAAELAGHGGLTSISYFGRSPGSAVFFTADPLSVWSQLFRQYLEVNGDLYYLEFNDTTIHPYGYESRFSVEGVKISHQITLLNDAICFSMRVLEKSRNDQVRMKLVLMSEVTEVKNSERIWSPFSHSERENAIIAKVVDKLPLNPHSLLQSGSPKKQMLTQHPLPDFVPLTEGETFIGLTCGNKLEFAFCQRLGKTHIRTAAFETGCDISLFFASDSDSFTCGLRGLSQSAGEECRQTAIKHADAIRNQPQFDLENKTLQSMMSCFPSVVESLKVKDVPGGMRAADTHYWIWGWDNMVYSDANLIAGDSDFVAKMLLFYKNTSHPEFGIFHALDRNGKPSMGMAAAAQCLYAVMLHRYYVFTRDKTLLEELYPFAAGVVMNAMKSEIGGTGLIEGVALFPDIPDDLGQNGHDISTFNNSIFYQGLRCAEELAEIVENTDDKKLFETHAEKIRSNFNKYLFDQEKGYYVDSVSSLNFSKRRHYPAYAILWLTSFAEELVGDKMNKVATFMKNNFPHRFGQSMFPRWDTQKEIEGNPLEFEIPQHESFYIPVVEGFYRETQRISGSLESNLPEIMETCWRQISIPEGIDCDAVNNGIVLNRPGQKQLFCLTSWYSLFFRNLLGLEFSLKGLSVSTPIIPGTATEVSGIRFGEKKIRLTISGDKSSDFSITLNHELLRDNFIEYDLLRPENHIHILRGDIS